METNNLQQAMAAAGTTGDLTHIKQVFNEEILKQAQSVAKKLNIPNIIPVDEGIIGDFPWFWDSGGNFNAKTLDWINNVFRFEDSTNGVGTDGNQLITAYQNLINNISFQLSASDQDTLNKAILANETLVNTILSTWKSTFGPIPTKDTQSQNSQMKYISQQVLMWGASGLTLDELRKSQNPISLLPNHPFGSEQFIGFFMEYLGKTSAVANLQQLQTSRNAQITQILSNLTPNVDPNTQRIIAKKGWMPVIESTGTITYSPQMNINQSTATIQNNLFPQNGGAGFSVGLSVTKIDSQTVKVTADGGVSGSGWIDFFRFNAGASDSYNMFSFNKNIESVEMSISFTGITKVTPSFESFNSATNIGWWFPKMIQEAVNYNPSESGFKFNTDPHFNFDKNGNFGVLSNILIAQEPTFSLTYSDTDYSYFKEVFEEHSSWGVSFLGIPLFGGSQSYFHSTVKEDTTKNTVTITIAPPAQTTSVPPLDQLAHVIGAEILWPGA